MSSSLSKSPSCIDFLQVSNLQALVAGRKILANINFSLAAGKFIAVLGLNGMGKSTLLRTIVGVDRFGTAEIRLNGNILWSDLQARERARICTWIPEPCSLSFPFSVYEVVLLGRYPWHAGLPNNADHLITHKTLEALSLAHISNSNVNTLSSGERQQVLLARGLNNRSPVIVIDEPTANLDAKRESMTLQYLRKLVDAGHTVIASIHNLHYASLYSDVAIVVDSGKAILYDPAEKAFVTDVVEKIFACLPKTSKTNVLSLDSSMRN